MRQGWREEERERGMGGGEIMRGRRGEKTGGKVGKGKGDVMKTIIVNRAEFSNCVKPTHSIHRKIPFSHGLGSE